MINREKYLKEIRPFYDSDLIKIITGIRRCGKSIILELIRNEIAQKSDNIIFLNFEDILDLKKASTPEEILQYVEKNKKDGKCYVFLDEIQTISGWPIVVKSLRLHNSSVFISGSNSKLLSKEFATELSGRYVSFRIRPFVYKEIIEICKELQKEPSILDYLIWGGFPKRFEMSNDDELKRYLLDLEDTIVIKDLVMRYKIKKEALFRRVVNYVLRSNSRIFSARSVHKYIKSENIECSSNTILHYIEYLKQAYVIDEISLYSNKVKRELLYYSKIYDADVCFNSLKISDNKYDLDHNLENIVYSELLYMGYDIKTYDNNGKEVDFICQKNGKTIYVQVAYSVLDSKAYDREFKAFESLDNQNLKVLITNDDIDYSTSLVKHIKLKDFLLMDELL